MNDTSGIAMVAAVRQIRDLMIDVSKLLLEADAIMGASGWAARVGSTSLAGGATSINSAKNWIPYRAFRFYRKDDAPLVIPVISVILDEQGPNQPVTQPLVSALVTHYESAEDIPEGYQLYNTAGWHLFVPDRRDDGTIIAIAPRELWKDDATAKARQMKSFAVPLLQIESREKLEELVVKPLLTMIREPVDAHEAGS